MPTLFKRSTGFYYVVFEKDGKRIYKSTGEKNHLKAGEKAETMVAYSESGMRLSEFTDKLLKYARSTYSPRNVEMYERVMKEFKKCIGDKILSNITPYDLEEYKAARLSKVSPVSVNIDLRTLKASFNRAVEWEIISRSPARRTRLVRVPDRRPAYFSESDLLKLHDVINQKWLLNIVVFAVATGMRQGEILGLKWDRVDMLARKVHIENKDGFRAKAGKERDLPLNDIALGVLSGIERRSTYVFVDSGGDKVRRDTLTKTFKKLARKIGLDESLHFHSLRHTFASWLVQRGVSLYHIQKLLGHSSVKVTEIYSHLREDNLRESVSVLDSVDGMDLISAPRSIVNSVDNKIRADCVSDAKNIR